jgi:hypothetical protein
MAARRGTGGEQQGSQHERPAKSAHDGTSGARSRARIDRMDDSWILFVEAGGVLALMLFFVWWTMRGRK